MHIRSPGRSSLIPALAHSGFNARRFLRNAAIIAVGVVGAVALWFTVLDDYFIARRFGEVTPTVFRSGQLSPHVVRNVLEHNGIRRIIDLTEAEYMPPGKIREREVARELGIEVLSLPLVGDGTGDFDTYARAVAALIESDTRGEPVLVHCAAGTQRTGGVVASFRILHQGWSMEDALREAQRYDWKPSQVAMPAYLDENLSRIREYLLARGLLTASATGDRNRQPRERPIGATVSASASGE